MTRTTTRKPAAATTEAQATERERQQALRDEKIARTTPKEQGAKVAASAAKAKATPKAKPTPQPDVDAPMAETEDTAAYKAVVADRYKNLTPASPASERHAAVKALHATGLFTYVEMARIAHYANGGVARNIVIPPARKGRNPLERYAGNLDGMAEFLRARGELALAMKAEALAKQIAALGK